jgi:hypothetical protein
MSVEISMNPKVKYKNTYNKIKMILSEMKNTLKIFTMKILTKMKIKKNKLKMMMIKWTWITLVRS